MLQASSCKCLQGILIQLFFLDSNNNSLFYPILSHFHGSMRDNTKVSITVCAYIFLNSNLKHALEVHI